MKISLGIESECLNGYTYVGVSKNLNQFCDDAQCTEIYSTDIINYIPYYEIEKYITHLVSKMRKGCKIILGGIDAMEACKMCLRQDFSILEYNKIIYGEDKKRPTCCHMTLSVLTKLLQSNGLKIMKKRLDGIQMIVEAIRE